MKKRHYTKYTKELLEPIVKSSTSFAECLRKLGLEPKGGNHRTIQLNVDKFNIDTSHMLHQGHNRGKEIKTFDELKRPDAIKKRLISERCHQCEKCLLTVWLDLPITLELEHVDGNSRNNERPNLKLLCPNCHSQTSTWKNRKRVVETI